YLANTFRGKLNINWEQEGSAILNLSMQGPLPQKDLDFMKTYIQVVIDKGLEEKNQRATNTIHFIDEQMYQLSDSLSRFSSDIDNFKIENRQITQGGSFVFEQLSEMESRQAEIELSNRYYDYLENYIKQDREEGIFAPNLIGLNAPLLDELVNQYIEIKMQGKLLKNESNQENPLINRENERRERVELNIFESLNNLREFNKQRSAEVKDKMNFYYGSIEGFLKDNRELDRMNTIYGLNRELYNLLLQRKTEASISRASTTSDYQIVEEPSYSRIPISPDTKKNYLYAVLIGLGFPIGLIFLGDALNNKIVTRDDLAKHTTIPLIGNIGHSDQKTNMVVKEAPQSQIAETFRHIRANLKYFIDEKARIFLVTSSFGSEGKTFCSINLAWIYALSGKRTLLLGADMRKPTMTRYLDLSSKLPGLSNYLVGFSTYEEVLTPTGNEDLFVITGGDVPPNPSELLSHPKMVDLLQKVSREFEIVIIDTPPIGVVADAMELLKYTDFNLLVVRQGKTIKSSLDHVSEMYASGKIRNFGILFNDINFKRYSYAYGYGNNYGYGYGYGYGYYDQKKKKKSLKNLF
ncbi:MAG: polysaccharide biosynthesis tyrosine autokinase, partial [Cyclobacteriaceae bacterium]|nr:polysaccharide biosynthesis tyrosine autokinase [Cyclobacteriaceae bacterium]